ncbi:sulfotransferase family protein [Wenzhouxiangella sp. XN79A]|uniref:sulfotransferase family 2 domain-containing protein n=1 Tax=Wenzhouxiangella sp. XN79A TaxID=2724193 RepID=UPI00144A9273|nr:sulfotransferase family 2 domain-containing protein [Wenzhouxiangella sp. XN79A]NKI36428.1 sulfotransferase family protein [Wenzhouxiangella sp. XN79A]
MLLSCSHNFIFIHIVKAAGSSVTASLTPYANRPETRLPNRIIRKLGLDVRLPGRYREFPVHIWASRLRDRVPAQFFDNAFKFTFVRNPWDWQVSLYHWYRDHPEHILHELVSKMRFEEYAQWRADTPPLYYQRNYLVDEKDDPLVDYIGRFENLADDFNEICQRIGVPSQLPQVNITRNRGGRDYRTYYTDRSAELIRKTYERDIAFFNYRFE